MNPGSRKRKHRSHRPQSPPDTFHSKGYHPRTLRGDDDEIDNEPDPLHALYIQAYEADLIRGSHAKTAAQSLEVVEYASSNSSLNLNPIPRGKIGSALIRWSYTEAGKSYRQGDEDDTPAVQDTEVPIWVDRYDARLLLDTLPTNPKVPVMASEPNSPTSSGWSDLPSDTEDTFFFTPDETEDFRKEKRRRLIEQTREGRLKARMEEDHVEDEEISQEDEDIWGGSDEEPDDSQQELMRRTANHLLSSTNAAQLEMRILANYGIDKRFAFLRGRWSRRWNLIKVKARLEKEKENKAGLDMITGYGSDDDDSADGGEVTKGKVVEEAALKEARRKRAKEWAEKRREMKLKGDTI